MVDDVHVDRHPLALDGKVGNEDWRDGDRGRGVHRVPTTVVVRSSAFLRSARVAPPLQLPSEQPGDDGAGSGGHLSSAVGMPQFYAVRDQPASVRASHVCRAAAASTLREECEETAVSSS